VLTEEHYRLQGDFAKMDATQAKIDALTRHAWQIQQYSIVRFARNPSDEDVQAMALASEFAGEYRPARKVSSLTTADETEGDEYRRWTGSVADNLRKFWEAEMEVEGEDVVVQ